MEINKVTALYFSPTGGTKAVTEDVAKGIAGGDAEIRDLTVKAESLCFGPGDVVVFGVPVFGGRVPAPAADRIAALKAEGTAAVLLTVFGNRAIDDALLELKTLLEARGFHTVAAAAFVARHSVCSDYGRGRPDNSDKEAQAGFAAAVRGKLDAAACASDIKSPDVPGNPDYVKYDGIPVKPEVSRLKCCKCGKCAENCPVGAIPVSDPCKTDKKKCISCMRCISVCPQYARHINPIIAVAVKKLLAKSCSSRKEPQIYL